MLRGESSQPDSSAPLLPEAFSIRRLEGRRWQWRALLWSYWRELARIKRTKRLDEADWIRRKGDSSSHASNFASCTQGTNWIIRWHLRIGDTGGLRRGDTSSRA